MLKRFTLLFFLCCFFIAQSQEQPEFCDQLKAIQALVKDEHFKPKILDDSLSVGVFNLFLAQLENNKKLFTKDDMVLFENDRLQFDNYIADNDCALIDSCFEPKTEYPLTPQNGYNARDTYHSQWEAYSELIDNKTSSLVVSNTSSTNEVLSYNDDQKNINTATLNNIQKDIYIYF